MRYKVIKPGYLGIIAAGLAVCLALGVLGGGAKSIMTWAKNEKRPIYSVNTSKSEVSLGINCAWDNADIPLLLGTLDAYKIKATFFIVGDWCRKYPESVKMISDAGHDIGSHSDTHADMTKLDDSGILREIRASSERLQAVTGTPVTLFRVPSGAWNSRVVELIEAEGMYPIQWDCEVLHMKTRKGRTV